MFICEISIIINLIYRKLGSVGLEQQKIKLPLPNLTFSNYLVCNRISFLMGFL